MEEIAVKEIDDWVRVGTLPGRHEAVLHSATSPEAGGMCWNDAVERAFALFLQVFAQFVQRFGEPDFPAESGFDWREFLGLRSDLLAVWDFDYYQLSLRVTCQSRQDSDVVLAKHIA